LALRGPIAIKQLGSERNKAESVLSMTRDTEGTEGENTKGTTNENNSDYLDLKSPKPEPSEN
jgi:hypothetical protein